MEKRCCDVGALRLREEANKLQMKTSKKGTYLAVMAVATVLFVLYLFIAPSFLDEGVPIPPFVYGIIFIAVLAVAAGLSIWRERVKKINPLDREEGVVSGQDDHHRR